MRHEKVLTMHSAPVRHRPGIQTKLINTAFGHPFAWQATFGDWDLGDPIGVGATESEAIEDLQMEDELNAD